MSSEKKETSYDIFMSILKENRGQSMSAREIAEKVKIKRQDFFQHRVELKQQLNSKLQQKLSNEEIEKWALSNIAANITSVFAHVSASSKRFIEEGGRITRDPSLKFEFPKSTENDDNQIDSSLKEEDLYPLLVQYLYEHHDNTHSMRIDETKSKKKGKKRNLWLHPDIVGLKMLHNDSWEQDVVDCLKNGYTNKMIDLYSFEVKTELNTSNVRESFFQALSNSGWANYGYIVTTETKDNVDNELKILSNLYGIGVIILDIENLEDSEIMFRATRHDVDWSMVNRIAEENPDFQKYVKEITSVLKDAKIREKYWGYEDYVKQNLIIEPNNT